MSFYNIATITLNQTALDWKGNTNHILTSIERITNEVTVKPDLFLFPELCISGYTCEDAFFSPHTLEKAWEQLLVIANESFRIIQDSVVIVGLPYYFNGALYNCSAVISNSNIYALVPKMILANDGVHNELRWFKAFQFNKPQQLNTSGDKNIVFGSVAFEHKKVRCIIENCRDAWALDRPAQNLIDTNYDIVLHPTASCFSFDKYKLRRNILLESSRRLVATFIMSNALGCEGGGLIFDGHLCATSDGKLLFENISYTKQDFIAAVLQVDVNINRIKKTRLHPSQYFDFKNSTCKNKEQNLVIEIPSKQHINTILNKSEVLIITPSQKYNSVNSFQDLDIFEQFLQVEVLGLFDTLRKSKQKGFMLPLSGGADSSTCAILIQRMLALSIQELGVELALTKLGHLELLDKVALHFSGLEPSLKEVVHFICPYFLEVVYIKTKNNTSQSLQSAQKLSDSLGSKLNIVNIQNEIDATIASVENLIKEKLSFEKNDIPIQNIQARSRVPLAWLLADLNKFILMSTANRSEIAVGYATMDGDTSGGLAPLGGVSKSFILQWLVHMQKIGDSVLGPIPELEFVNSMKPSAELKSNQFDEHDLMPYNILDRIIILALQFRKSKNEIIENLILEFPNIDTATINNYITLFINRFHTSQWKRKRLAYSFYLDELSLDPSHFRFPILNAIDDT